MESADEPWHVALFASCTAAEVSGGVGICSFGFCWSVLVVQATLGVALLVYVIFHPERWRFEILSQKASSAIITQPFQQLDGEEPPTKRALEKSRRSSRDVRKLVLQEVLTPLEQSMTADFGSFVAALRTEPSFCRHQRTETNFMRSNADPALVRPPNYPTERWASDLTRSKLYRYLFLFQLRDTFLLSFAFALIASAASTLLWMLTERERFDLGGTNFFFWSNAATTAAAPVAAFLASARHTIDSLQSNFKFYPIFLIQGYAAYAIVRWRDFVLTSYAIQGRIHDIALICGGALANPSELRSRRLMFRLYRYLNAVHLLCYQNKHEWLRRLNIETSCVKLGLLTPEESRILWPMANKARDTLLAWISSEVQAGVADGLLYPSCATTALDNVAFLRGKMAAFHDQFATNQPALWAALMIFMVDVLVIIILLGSPLQFYLETGWCFQWWTVIGAQLLVLPFMCTTAIIQMLQNPFVGEHGDVFNVDSLMASTEQCVFACLRSRFDQRGSADATSGMGGADEQCVPPNRLQPRMPAQQLVPPPPPMPVSDALAAAPAPFVGRTAGGVMRLGRRVQTDASPRTAADCSPGLPMASAPAPAEAKAAAVARVSQPASRKSFIWADGELISDDEEEDGPTRPTARAQEANAENEKAR